MSYRTNRRTKNVFRSEAYYSMTRGQKAADTARINEERALANAQESLRINPNQAVWITLGRGFGRRTGWLTPYGFFPTSSYRGGRPSPGHGGVKAGDKQLDLSTGKLTPWRSSGAPIYLQSYAQAESAGITPRDEIISTIYDPGTDKILAFEEGHTFSNVGRNRPSSGWGTFLIHDLENDQILGKVYADTTIHAHDLAMRRYPQLTIDVIEVPQK